MTVPENLADAYKAFFKDSEAGRYYVEQLMGILDSNIDKAQNQNSLDFLSRSRGNKEAFDLFDNVISAKEATRSK